MTDHRECANLLAAKSEQYLAERKEVERLRVSLKEARSFIALWKDNDISAREHLARIDATLSR